MRSLDELEARIDLLSERDRVAAHLHGRPGVAESLSTLLDTEAKAALEARIMTQLEELRDEARAISLEAARAVLMELRIDDLARLSSRTRALERWLDEKPSERIACARDLTSMLRDLRAIEGRGPLPSERV